MLEERVISRGGQEKTPRQTKSLGRRIIIPFDAEVIINEKPVTIAYGIPSVELNIGIGSNHDAILIMSKDAWEELKETGLSLKIAIAG